MRRARDGRGRIAAVCKLEDEISLTCHPGGRNGRLCQYRTVRPVRSRLPTGIRLRLATAPARLHTGIILTMLHGRYTRIERAEVLLELPQTLLRGPDFTLHLREDRSRVRAAVLEAERLPVGSR